MKYVISIGINDYRNGLGGTNKVILAHEELFCKSGYHYLYISPVKILGKKSSFWEVILNHKHMGIKNTNNLLAYLKVLSKKGQFCEVHIHHLLNAQIKEVDKLLAYIVCSIKFYIHDYYSICPSIRQLYNDSNFCGKGQVSDEKCSGCCYYKLDKERQKEIQCFFEKYSYRTIFIAPSYTAKEIWASAYPEYGDKVRVIYHQKYIGEYRGNNSRVRRKIKLAYVGEQIGLKGWDIWKELIRKLPAEEYDFYYFGRKKEEVEGLTNISVDFHESLSAMVEALRNAEIDCVILWSIWPETYSYTYYESSAANTFVLTNQLSGNIAAQVRKRKNGIVVDDAASLIELLCNTKTFREKINEYKQRSSFSPLFLEENDAILYNIDEGVQKNFEFNGTEKGKIIEDFINFVFLGLKVIKNIKRKYL